MSSLSPLNQLCGELLKLYFGDVVSRVGTCLLRRGHRPLHDIATTASLSIDEAKKALAVLIQHNLVKFEACERNHNITEYSAITHHIYSLLRYPRYLYMMKLMYGDQEEMLLEMLLNQGQDSASNVIFQAAIRFKEAREESGDTVDPATLYEKFVNLAANQFVVRCANVAVASSATEKIPKFDMCQDMDWFSVPALNIAPLSQKLKENISELGEYSDSGIIWRVNYEKFDIEMRNVILVNAAARRVDPIAGELYHILLQLWSECTQVGAQITNPVDVHQIKERIRKSASSSLAMRENLDQYLRILHEDSSCLLTKVGDAGGGQYLLSHLAVFENLACTTLDSIVLEKFGSKALRLFRVARSEKYVEHDRMHSASMILPKEVKMLSYHLLENNFLQMQELKKGTSVGAMMKSFILFHVDIPQVARMVLQSSYKGVYNALVRKSYIIAEHKRLIEKHERMESMLASLREDGASEEEIAYVEESITPAEKSLVAKVHAMTDLLTLGLSQVDETILILQTYIQYVDCK